MLFISPALKLLTIFLLLQVRHPVLVFRWGRRLCGLMPWSPPMSLIPSHPRLRLCELTIKEWEGDGRTANEFSMVDSTNVWKLTEWASRKVWKASITGGGFTSAEVCELYENTRDASARVSGAFQLETLIQKGVGVARGNPGAVYEPHDLNLSRSFNVFSH